MNSDVTQYAFYALLVAASGLGEYFHLLPTGTMVAILGLITGHFFGNGATKSVLSNIASNVGTMTNQVTENANIAKGIAQAVNAPVSVAPTTEATKEVTPNA